MQFRKGMLAPVARLRLRRDDGDLPAVGFGCQVHGLLPADCAAKIEGCLTVATRYWCWKRWHLRSPALSRFRPTYRCGREGFAHHEESQLLKLVSAVLDHFLPLELADALQD